MEALALEGQCSIQLSYGRIGGGVSDVPTRMKLLRIERLKARLSEYLRVTRSDNTITVPDPEIPVAQLAPIGDRMALRIRKPKPGTPPPNRVPLPKHLTINVDVVQLLLDDRRR